ncbi:fibronectin type III domain-containing protein [Streptomyces sp. NPDC048518]|uniref:fibronectin type III domain-containing protein n=1 Tax=Streptomyces sp. NPDC048518 TaxID=3155029 RepID=UPI0033E28164
MRRIPPLSAPLALLAAVAATAVALGGCAWSGDDAGDTNPPAAPRGLTVQAGSSTTAHVMWNRATDDTEVTGYEVYRDAKKVKEVAGGEQMVDVVGLAPDATYTFTVRARDAEGNVSEDSERLSVTMPAAAAADRKAPSRPGRLTGRAAGSSSAMLSWGKSSDDRRVASYEIYQGGSKVHSVGGGQTATLVTGLRPGTDYTFTVKARDAADNFSPASSRVRLTTAGGGKGSGRGTAPTAFRAGTHEKDGAYYIDLSWVPPRTGGAVAEYQIQLDGRTATSLVFGGTAPKDRAEHSFYIGRKSGEPHRVRVRPKLPDGTWGGYTPERTVTTG